MKQPAYEHQRLFEVALNEKVPTGLRLGLFVVAFVMVASEHGLDVTIWVFSAIFSMTFNIILYGDIGTFVRNRPPLTTVPFVFLAVGFFFNVTILWLSRDNLGLYTVVWVVPVTILVIMRVHRFLTWRN